MKKNLSNVLEAVALSAGLICIPSCGDDEGADTNNPTSAGTSTAGCPMATSTAGCPMNTSTAGCPMSTRTAGCPMSTSTAGCPTAGSDSTGGGSTSGG